MPKEEKEFFDINALSWRPVEGYPEGCWERILSSDETGWYTRILRFEPGVETTETLTHDFWEEVYILKGGLIDKRTGDIYPEGTYACRPPGMKHGPYKAPIGCITIEFRYYR